VTPFASTYRKWTAADPIVTFCVPEWIETLTALPVASTVPFTAVITSGVLERLRLLVSPPVGFHQPPLADQLNVYVGL